MYFVIYHKLAGSTRKNSYIHRIRNKIGRVFSDYSVKTADQAVLIS